MAGTLVKLTITAALTGFGLLAGGACARPAAPASPPAPVAASGDTKGLPAAAPPTAAPGPWIFRHATNATTGYRVAQATTIENRTEPRQSRTSREIRHETVVLRSGPQGRVHAEVLLDSLPAGDSTPPQRLPDSTIRLSATLSAEGPLLEAAAFSESCAYPSASITVDARTLLVRFPETLEKDVSWARMDSARSCQGGATTTSRSSYTYTTVGEATGEFAGLLHIRRTGIIDGEGEGTEQGHRIRLFASGQEITDYYLDLNGGRIRAVRANQALEIRVEASGRTSFFLQHSRRDYDVTR